MKTHNIFVSHSWAYGDAYDMLINFFKREPYFNYKDYSVPKDDPIHNAPNAALLEQAIENKIRPCSVVVIMAGKYATYSKWINIEIKIAKRLGKPIVAIRPWAALQTSQIVTESANEIISWNGASITSGIKRNSLQYEF